MFWVSFTQRVRLCKPTLCHANEGSDHTLKEVGTFQVAVVVDKEVNEELTILGMTFQALEYQHTVCHVHWGSATWASRRVGVRPHGCVREYMHH